MRRALLLSLFCVPALVAQVPASPVGDWNGTIQTPGPGLKIQITLEAKAGAWAGRISVPTQGVKDLPLGDILVAEGSLAFALTGIPGDPRFKGRRQADGSYAGEFTQGGQSIACAFQRAEAGPAPTSAPEPSRSGPGDRDLAFPGFNAFPLKGSVRAGKTSPYFAVMVAASGPTDRNWSNPLIPVPSHGGRDLALWLQEQGLGSLRYDKRFIGSVDPKLDISLDAQLGDVKGALKAARLVPEARGKKLLLVGHSEGALLALLAAGDADAALLLAMPGMSMGKLIVAQVKASLDAANAPADVAKLNLDFLEDTLGAIRKHASLPGAAAGVAPGVVGLAKALGRPESLTFVRDLLDLDPWGAAQRLTIPCAVVWGDRDIQTWRPATLPAEFKGAVLEIAGANHLLKREPRSRAELSGQTAMSAYGDDTPLADLAPLALWLRLLK